MNLPIFAETTLDQLAIPFGPSEVHGLLCGLLCSLNASTAKTRWFAELLDAAELSADQVAGKADQLRQLDSWHESTLEALNDSELSFTPALPDDDAPVAERVLALGEFCAGFTYGLGIGIAQSGNRTLPADTRELIEDFQAIDSADPKEAQHTDEQSFVELAEYVRVGVLLVHEELKPVINTGAGRIAGHTPDVTPGNLH